MGCYSVRVKLRNLADDCVVAVWAYVHDAWWPHCREHYIQQCHFRYVMFVIHTLLSLLADIVMHTVATSLVGWLLVVRMYCDSQVAAWYRGWPEPVPHCVRRLSETPTTWGTLGRWFAAQRCYVHKTCFRENSKDTKVVCPVMWTYDICSFDTGTYCVYYWQNQDILQWCKQNKHFCGITGNKYYTLHVVK